MKPKKTSMDKLIEQIKEAQKDPDFIRAAHEFIKRTTS